MEKRDNLNFENMLSNFRFPNTKLKPSKTLSSEDLDKSNNMIKEDS